MKNPTILEGGIARVFSNIRKLFTRENNTDNLITWVPESDRQLTTKYITQNGVYRAADDGYYAYSSVTVSVSTDSGATGEGDDGEQHYVAPNPETGELVDEVIPSSIQIVTPPTNPYGIYKNGQAIGKDGMVVKAYLASGELYTELPDGIVPNEQITLVPNKAEYDESTDYAAREYDDIECHYLGGASVTIKGVTSQQNPIFEKYTVISGDGPFYIFGTRYHDALGGTGIGGFICSINSFVYKKEKYAGETRGTSRLYQYDGKEIYYAGRNAMQDELSPTVDAPLNEVWYSTTRNLTEEQCAWIICYGVQTKQQGSHQTITAEWPRVGDGAVLSTEFEILVAPPIYGGGEA